MHEGFWFQKIYVNAQMCAERRKYKQTHFWTNQKPMKAFERTRVIVEGRVTVRK